MDISKLNSTDLLKLGQSLKAVDEKLLKPLSQGRNIWFRGEEKYFDLFMIEDQEKIKWIQVTFRGHYLDWKENQKIQTGRTNEYDESASTSPASKMLRSDGKPNLNFIKVIVGILDSRTDNELLKKASKILGNYTSDTE